MRNPVIEIARYVFAFLVVVIHVPLTHGGTLLMPVARCAVPFFYLVTGYFLAKSMVVDESGDKFRRSIIKWFCLWIKYAFVFFVISLVIDISFNQLGMWNVNDVYWMFLTGCSPFIDQHIWNGKIYGVTTLWFLYCGFLSLCVLYILRRFIFKRWFLLVVVLVQIIAAITVYIKLTSWLFFYSSLPFIYYGIVMGNSLKKSPGIKNKRKILIVLIASVLLFFIGVIEYKLTKDVVVTNLPLSLGLFILLLNTDKLSVGLINRGVYVTSSQYTLDVYIWHRLVYYLLIVVGFNFMGWDAVIVFLITLFGSMMIRKLIL